jgi:ethanolamine ammonia-lyase small subunit
MTRDIHGDDDRDDKAFERAPTRHDPWHALSALTPARIGLGRTGSALRTRTHLDFLAAHAMARDAVHRPWDPRLFHQGLHGLDALPVHIAASAAADRQTYLARPELGRRLADGESSKIEAIQRPEGGWDVAVVMTDGLSAEAVERHGAPLLAALRAALGAAHLSLAPLVLVALGRVAIADPIGSALGARVSMIIVGERPGLSAADSLGLYLTFAPRPGRTDAERNCISNIHPPDGLDYGTAARKATWLAREALSRGHSGVALKDESPSGLSLVRSSEG